MRNTFKLILANGGENYVGQNIQSLKMGSLNLTKEHRDLLASFTALYLILPLTLTLPLSQSISLTLSQISGEIRNYHDLMSVL